jgi:tetratricopeptide (TPR) repeat protein
MELKDIEKILAEAKFIHLTDSEIVAYHDNELDGFTFARAEAHLKRCRVCEGRRAAFVKWQILTDELILSETEADAPRAEPASEPRRQSSSRRHISVAVLPPEKIDINDAGGILMCGVLDRYISSLGERSQVGDVQFTVSSLRAVLNAREPLSNPVAVGKELKVDHVLRIIDVRRDGQAISVTTRLIDVWGGAESSRENFDKGFRTAPAGDEGISEKEMRRLNLKLFKAEQRRLGKWYTENPSASRKYMQGRFYLNTFPGRGLTKAIVCFNDAVEFNQTFAEAHSGLADCFLMKGIYNVSPPSDSFGLALGYAKKALEINPKLAEAHTSRGYIYMCYEWDWVRAKEEFEKALEQNPNYALAYQGYAHLLGAMGEFSEAIRKSERAHKIDPASPMLYVVRAFIYYYYAGCHLEAEEHCLGKAREQCLHAISLNERFDPAWYILALIYVQLALACKRKGRVDKAEEYFREAEDAAKKARQFARHNAQKQALLTFIYLLWGKEDEAVKSLEGLKEALTEDSYISPYHMALLHVARSRTDDAIWWLRKAFRARDQWMILMRYEPAFKVLRGDERFQDLLRRLNFPLGSKGGKL